MLKNNNLLIKALRDCIDELYSIHSQYGDKQNARDHSFALEQGQKVLDELDKKK